jgi:hypothetical protein
MCVYIYTPWLENDNYPTYTLSRTNPRMIGYVDAINCYRPTPHSPSHATNNRPTLVESS